MFVDGLMVWGITMFERSLHHQHKAKSLFATGPNGLVGIGEAADVILHNEIDKKETRALRAAGVQQRKIEQKIQQKDRKFAHSAPKNPITQPDKNMKSIRVK